MMSAVLLDVAETLGMPSYPHLAKRVAVLRRLHYIKRAYYLITLAAIPVAAKNVFTHAIPHTVALLASGLCQQGFTSIF